MCILFLCKFMTVKRCKNKTLSNVLFWYDLLAFGMTTILQHKDKSWPIYLNDDSRKNEQTWKFPNFPFYSIGFAIIPYYVYHIMFVKEKMESHNFICSGKNDVIPWICDTNILNNYKKSYKHYGYHFVCWGSPINYELM